LATAVFPNQQHIPQQLETPFVNKLLTVCAGAMLVTVTACSKKSETESTAAAPAAQAPAAAAQTAPAAQSAMPADAMHQQAMASAHPGGMPMTGAAPAAQPGAMGANGGQGKIVNTMHASSYTYMEVDTGGRKVWIATNAMQVNNGDTVRWNDGAVMKNFTSNALHRTFDEILFVSAAEVVK
jgi:hypothetical protein